MSGVASNETTPQDYADWLEVICMQLSRRQVLATGAVGGVGTLAGCADPDAVMAIEGVPTAQAIAERATLQPEQYPTTLVADAINGGTTRAADGEEADPPYTPSRPVVHNDTVYTLTWSAIDRQTQRTEYVLTLDVAADGPTPEIDYGDLPTVDQEAIGPLPEYVAQYKEAQQEAEEAPDPPEFERQRWYPPADRNASVLVPEPQYDAIGVNGYTTTVAVSSTTVRRQVFRYTATKEASTLATFGRTLTSQTVRLGGLGETERSFLESVRDEGEYYHGSGSDSTDAFERLADRLVAEPAIVVEDRQGEWLVEYEGSRYWVMIDFVAMEEYADRLESAEL